MALPTTPPIDFAAEHHVCPPFKSSAGAFYVVGTGDALGDELRVFKSSDPSDDATWTEQDAADNPDLNRSIRSLYGVQVGDVLHLVTQDSGADTGMGVFSAPVYYHTFNMATDQWVIVAELVDTPLGAFMYRTSLAVRSDGDVVVAYQDDPVTVMGQDWNRVVRNVRTGGSWGGPVNLGVPTAANDWAVDQGILGASDRTHFFLSGCDRATPRSFQLAHQSLSSADALDTIVVHEGPSTSLLSGHGAPAAWDDGGTVRVRVPLQLTSATLGGVIKFDSGANPTITQEAAHDNQIFGWEEAVTQMDVVCAAYLYDADVDTRHLIYVDATGRDVYHAVSAAGDGNWGTDTLVDSATAGAQITAGIYQRGTNIVLAFVWQESSTNIEYNEIVLRSVGTSLSVPVAVLTMAAAAPTVQAGAVTVSVPNAAISAVAAAPTPLAEKSLAVPNVSVPALALAPTVTAGNADVAVPNVPITATALVPTVQGGAISVAVPNIAISGVAAAPAVFAEISLSVTTALLEALAAAPAVAAGASSLTVPNIIITAVAAAPTAFGETNVAVPNVAITGQALAPTVVAGESALAVPNVSIMGVAAASTVFAETTITVANVVLVATALVPVVDTGGGGQTLDVPLITITGVTIAPTIQAGDAALSVPNVALEVLALAPAAQGGAASILVPNVEIIAAGLAPTVQAGAAAIAVANIELLTAALAPTAFGEVMLSVPNVVLLALALAPTVDTAGEQTLQVSNIELLARALAPTPLAGGAALSVPNAMLSAIVQPPSILALTQLSVPTIAFELIALAPTLLPGGTVLSVPNISIFVVVGPVDLEGGFEPAAGDIYIALGDGRVFRVVASSRACHVQAPQRFFHDRAMEKRA